MITEKTYKALKILAARTNWNTPIMAKEFAWLLWGDEPDKKYLFEAHTNTGNGACAGKKAWLCAGSLLGKLSRQGLAKSTVIDDYKYGYCITSKGREEILKYEETAIKERIVKYGR